MRGLALGLVVVAALAGVRLVAQANPMTQAQIEEFRKGAYEPGTKSGVTIPLLVKQVHPKYTPDGMREKIQGTVVLEAVVGVDGKVARARVIKSLDAVFGLDQSAIAAAKEWQFNAGALAGKPVPTLVLLELYFKLH